jgi:hypothetical protein
VDKAAKFASEHDLTLDTELNMTDPGVSAFRGKNARTGALGGFLVDAGRPGATCTCTSTARASIPSKATVETR